MIIIPIRTRKKKRKATNNVKNCQLKWGARRSTDHLFFWRRKKPSQRRQEAIDKWQFFKRWNVMGPLTDAPKHTLNFLSICLTKKAEKEARKMKIYMKLCIINKHLMEWNWVCGRNAFFEWADVCHLWIIIIISPQIWSDSNSSFHSLIFSQTRSNEISQCQIFQFLS